jgi:hypothetical protein
MEVVNCLSGSLIDVKYRPVPRLVDTKLHGHVFSNLKHVGEESGVFLLHIVECRNVLSRTHEQVHRRLRPYILENHCEVILIYDL